jgi:hypothetical protein
MRRRSATTPLGQKTVPAVDKECSAGPKKGQGPCQADQTDVAGSLWQQGPHLLTHRPWGVHHQSGIHCIGPGYLQEAHAEAEACSGGAGLFFHWDNIPVHSAAINQDWLTPNSI